MTPRCTNETEDGFLFPGESPADLMGFSIIFDKTGNVSHYYMIRVPIKSRASVSRQVQRLIAKLQGPRVTLTKATFEAWEDLGNQEEADSQNQNADSQNWNLPNVFYGTIGGKPKPYEYRMPLMGIYRPTLFIYTTNVKGIQFGGKLIHPKLPSKSLDPYCSNVRLWNNNEVMGLYSQYDCNIYPDKSEYWYYLEIGAPAKGLAFGPRFDPGNGNGGGPEFP